MSLPVDIGLIVHEMLAEGQRPPDGLLHPSSDLIDLRHAQLRYAGFPEVEKTDASLTRLETGTMWHDRLHDRFRAQGLPFMAEVKLGPWLPEEWEGTADWLVFDPTAHAWQLVDLKTTTGQGVGYRATEGMSESHWLQASAYWLAASRMGLPMVEKVYVYYLPMDDSGGSEAVLCEDVPAPAEDMDAMMDEIRTRCHEVSPPGEDEVYLDKLAPPQERVQKLTWNNTSKVFDLKLHPHWLTRYCPFGSELCGCGDEPTTKIGHYEMLAGELTYVRRRGWEDTYPEVTPSTGELRKRYGASD